MKTASVIAAFLAGTLLAGCGGSSNNDNVPQPGHTAPTGMWGGTLVSDATEPATLTLTNSGGRFVFPCGETAVFMQAIQPDSSGQFSVSGTTHLVVGQLTALPTQFVGTVTNHVMTVTLTVTPPSGTPYTDGPYTVTFAQAAPTYQGVCPG